MEKRIDKASKLIHASPATIYEAFANPGALERWLPPSGMTGSMLEFDFREGGLYHMILSFDNPDHTPGKSSEHTDVVEVRFVRLIPNKEIEQAVTFNTENPEFTGEMKMTWTFEETGEGTTVKVFCEDVPEGIRPEDHEAGLTSTLENLAAFTEGIE